MIRKIQVNNQQNLVILTLAESNMLHVQDVQGSVLPLYVFHK